MKKYYKYTQLNYFLHKQDGFTLLESLFALIMTSMIILVFSTGITQTNYIKETIRKNQQMEWHIFLYQMQIELDKSLDAWIEIKGSSIIIFVTQLDEKNEENGIQFNLYTNVNGQTIFRRQNAAGRGHQPMLLEIQKDGLEISRVGDTPYLMFEVRFENGEEYMSKLYVHCWDDVK